MKVSNFSPSIDLFTERKPAPGIEVEPQSPKPKPTTPSFDGNGAGSNDSPRNGDRSPLSTIAVLPVSNQGFTGNTYLDGILWGGNYWDSGSSPTVIDYSFWNSGTEAFDDLYGNITTAAYDWFSAERASMLNALNAWAAVANIQFVDAGDNQEPATLGFYNIDDAQSGGFLGAFFPPGENGMGIGYFNWQGAGWDFTNGMAAGSFGYITLIHELGHGLGLAHPHDNGGGSSIYPGVTSPFGSIGTYGLNQGLYTTMSYNDGLVYSGFDPGTFDYGYQGTPMAFDIAAIQHLYGANTTYNTGNNTYFLPTVNQGGTLTQPATMYACIWDAGGVDKISAAGALGGVTINLNAATLNAVADGAGAGGYLSSVTGIFGGYTIANGVVIERADGANFNDSLIGNAVANRLNGLNGNDTISGGGGKDSLIGAIGKDTLTGGSALDNYIYSNLNNSRLFNYDVITDYASGEIIDAPASVIGTVLTASTGNITSLTAAKVSTLLNSGVFAANTARAFTVNNLPGTFIALNDAVAGFTATSDSIIFLQNYTLGAATIA
ncbi:MAG: M10 family metallopeptidase [Elainella sp. Prado103]|jgi:serralysin|nr:M10 family metallopeptidase [Elainella sp. Prado103]